MFRKFPEKKVFLEKNAVYAFISNFLFICSNKLSIQFYIHVYQILFADLKINLYTNCKMPEKMPIVTVMIKLFTK